MFNENKKEQNVRKCIICMTFGFRLRIIKTRVSTFCVTKVMIQYKITKGNVYYEFVVENFVMNYNLMNHTLYISGWVKIYTEMILCNCNISSEVNCNWWLQFCNVYCKLLLSKIGDYEGLKIEVEYQTFLSGNIHHGMW